MSSNRAKVGIVGLGRWAKVLTRAVRTSNSIEIVQGFRWAFTNPWSANSCCRW